MTAAELLMCLSDQGIKLWAEGDKLRYKAPKGALTTEIRAAIAECKAELLGLLSAAQIVAGAAAPPIDSVSRRQELPLSFAQQELWLSEQAQPGSGSCSLSAAVRLAGWLDLADLTRAIATLRRRHEALRTTFAAVDSRPVQLIAPAAGIRPALLSPLLDLSALPATRREQVALALIDAALRRPFDLAQGPLLRIVLLRLALHEHMLLLALHPIIADDWSLDVLIDELRALYDAWAAGELIVLPVLPIQYADYAVWERQRLRGAPLEAHRAYWRRQLAGAPTALLPADHPRPAALSCCGAAQTIALEQPLVEALRSLSQQAGTTLFVTLLAAFQTLLYRCTGQEDLVVGTPIANRTRVETEGVIGRFVTMLPLRAQLDGQARYSELLAQVHQLFQDACTYRDLSEGQIVEALALPRSSNGAPLVQVVFALQNAPPAVLDLAGLQATPLLLPRICTGYDLTLKLTELANGMQGTLVYCTALFEPPTIARLGRRFRALLLAITADPQRRLAELLPLETAER